jgi:hypothetical protein
MKLLHGDDLHSPTSSDTHNRSSWLPEDWEDDELYFEDDTSLAQVEGMVSLRESPCVEDKPAPIQNLPTELLQRIFLYSLPGLPYPYLPEIIPDFEEIDEDAEHITCARSRLTHICRKWRNLAFSTTQLWTTIALVSPIPNDSSIVEQWFKYSGSRSLDISFEAAWGVNYWDRRLPVVEIVKENMGRIRCLLTYDTIDAGLWSRLFPPGKVIEAPLLEALRIHSRSKGHSYKLIAPRLAHLSITSPINIAPSLNLRSFSGGGFVLKLLVHCSQLTDMSLYIDQVSTTLLEPILFPALHSLSLTPRFGLGCASILQHVRHIKAKNLRRLEVWMNSNDAGVTCGELVDVLSQQYGSHLRDLELGCAALKGHNMARAFSNLPELEMLSLKYGGLGDDFFDALIPHSSSPHTSWPCPNLIELTLSETPLESTRSLIQLVRKRTLPDHHPQAGQHLPGFITSIMVLGSLRSSTALWNVIHGHSAFCFKGETYNLDSELVSRLPVTRF